jgi:hypothetical protein
MAKDYTFQVVHGYLELWKARSNLTKIGMNTNEGFEKIIQMLLSVQLEPHEVLQAVNEWTANHDYVAKKKKGGDLILGKEEKQKATLQSLICHLVYTYLAQCINPLFAHATDAEQAEANSQTGEKIDRALES